MKSFFGTEDVSDPDDTPEDVEDEEEPELFLLWRAMTGEFSLDLHCLSAGGGERLCDEICVSKFNLLMSGSLSIRLILVSFFFFVYFSSTRSTLQDKW